MCFQGMLHISQLVFLQCIIKFPNFFNLQKYSPSGKNNFQTAKTAAGPAENQNKDLHPSPWSVVWNAL